MKLHIRKFIFKTLRITGLTLLTIILLAIAIPFLFPQAINNKIKTWANSNIDGNIAFTKTRLSFFKHFPGLTLTMYDVTLKGSAPFQDDTLIGANEIAFGIDLSSVFKSKIKINKIFLDSAFINIQVDSAGRANYNIYKAQPQNPNAPVDTNGGASLGISKILIKNSRLVYNDQSLPMTINARGFNYTGSGDLSKDIFDLNSSTQIRSLDFYYARQPYVISKQVNATLLTEINTKSLTFIFSKNDLFINQLPVQFNGRFGFIKNGYDMDFDILSTDNDLNEIVSALPVDDQKLLAETEIKGTALIRVGLKGKYVVADSLAPDLTFKMQVRDGFISNKKSPSPVKNLYMDLEAKIPALNPDSMSLNIDSLHFNVADGFFNSVVRVKGIKVPDIYARVNSEIDLEKWDKAIGLQPFHVRGKYVLNLLAEGKYATATQAGKHGKLDTIITSIPKFTLRSSFREGYFKYTKLPQAIDHIGFDMTASCTDNNYKHISVSMENLDVTALNDYIKGYFKVANLDDFPVDADFKAKFNLGDLKNIYPIDSLDLKGDLEADIQAKGKYLPAQKKYPALAAKIMLKDGAIQTKYYPHPIEDMQVNTVITDKTGSLAGMNVTVDPISFSFEHEPFLVRAELHDFTNIAYKIHADGKLNLGNIYKVFAVKGYDVTGTVAAHLSLKGTQADATAGHYDKLSNKGRLTVKEINLTTDLYPRPFLISKGVFSFNQDKMQFDTFKMTYANSVFVLNGAVSDVIDYVVRPGSVLKGNFTLTSDMINVGDFMVAPAPVSTATLSAAPVNTPSTTPSVVMVPKNLDLEFNADVKTVKYTDLLIKDAKGHMTIKDGTITLKETGFNLIDAPISMDATYTGLTPQKATFDYHISAKDFDIHKAYLKIKLFRDMATSAASAEGLISIDYKLSGRLNSAMAPVYPSLKGGGVVTAQKIKMHGFKLFNAIAEKTNKDSVGGNPDVSKVEIKSTIANNIITIAPTKIRLAGFRAKFSGQVSFDKKLDLKFRLGLPPMGIIGIPMTITGTQDKPDIHLGKGKEGDELKETADDGDN